MFDYARFSNVVFSGYVFSSTAFTGNDGIYLRMTLRLCTFLCPTVFLQADGTNLDSVAGLLRGDSGSKVRLDVRRDGKTMTFPLTRAQFKVWILT